MDRTVTRRPSPAIVISVIALFLALGGTSFAASKLIAKNSVGSHQVVNGSLQSVDLSKKAKMALTGKTGLQGPMGRRALRALRTPKAIRVPKAIRAPKATKVTRGRHVLTVTSRRPACFRARRTSPRSRTPLGSTASG